MRSIIFRADASKEIGFGHFIRSLALTDYLKNDFDCRFCTFNPIDLSPSDYQMREISKVADYIPIKGRSYEEYDRNFLESLSGEEIVVLDNYYFTTEYQQKIKDKGCKLVCVGPVVGQHYVADAVITSNEKPRTHFSFEPYTRYFNGLKHAFLRKPFLDAEIKRKPSACPKTIVLAIGGADPYRLTNKLIKLILEVRPELQISLIAGDTVEVAPEFSTKVTIYRRLSAEKIVKLFVESDLGIFSASTICVEALACKLPIAAGWYVDNQIDFYNYGVREGLFLPLGNFLDADEALKGKIEQVLNHPKITTWNDIDFIKGKSDIVNLFRNL